MVFHVLNRGVARMQLFEKAADYQAFEQVLQDTLDQSPMRICAFAVMPNHWHLLLWPERDGELAAFMQRLTITHVRRWQEHRGYAGLGHVYQGRYKSFPVESDEHFWVVARYVERNALRANLVLRAEEWRWSSLWQCCHPTGEERSLLAAWPIDMPANWLERVNQTDDAPELEALRRSVQRGRPFGQPEWQKEIATFGPSRPIVPRVARERWAEIKMPRPGEDRSDVGGAAQFRTCPAFANRRGLATRRSPKACLGH
jgi:putative transposase